MKVLLYTKTTQQGKKNCQSLRGKSQSFATKSPKLCKLSNLNSLGKLTNMEIGFDEKPQDVNNFFGKDLPSLQGANTNAFMILICIGLNTILT